jgi:hypothetical protein
LGDGGFADNLTNTVNSVSAAGGISGAITIQANNVTFTAGTGQNSYAQLGDGDASKNGGKLGTVLGDLIALHDVTLDGNATAAPALIGDAVPAGGSINANLTVAVDQLNPLADNGGRRMMLNQFTSTWAERPTRCASSAPAAMGARRSSSPTAP